MTPCERRLLLEIAKQLASMAQRDFYVAPIKDAIALVEEESKQTERCSFDGNVRPCPHHDITTLHL